MQETPRDRLLREELADPERLKTHLARLIALLAEKVGSSGKCLVYVLAQPSRIGHLVLEPWILQTLFGDKYQRIVIVTGPEQEAANSAFFSYLRSRFTIVETDDIVLTTLGLVDGGAFSVQDFDFLLWTPRTLFTNFTKALANGAPHRFFEVSEAQLIPGRALRAERLSDAAKPYVVLHVRDEGFSPEMAYHAFRCNPVANYRDAVLHLLDAGYAVFRIGDVASPRLGITHPDYVELSHMPGYDRAADFALLAEAAFGIVTQSGPWAFLQALGRPILLTNAYPEPFWVFEEREVALFKHVFKADGAEMRYREICAFEAETNALTRNLLADHGMTSASNSAEEVLAGVEEMLDILSSGTPPDLEAQRAFLAITRAFDSSVVGAASERPVSPRYQRRLSRRFLKLNPDFLS